MASYHECTQSSCVHRPVSLIMIFSKFGTRSCAMGILRVFLTSKMNCWYLNCPILVCHTVFWKKNARIVHARARCVLLGCLINQTIIFYCVQLYSGGRGGDWDSWVSTHSGIQLKIEGVQILTSIILSSVFTLCLCIWQYYVIVP